MKKFCIWLVAILALSGGVRAADYPAGTIVGADGVLYAPVGKASPVAEIVPPPPPAPKYVAPAPAAPPFTTASTGAIGATGPGDTSVSDKIWAFIGSPLFATILGAGLLYILLHIPANRRADEQKWYGVAHTVYNIADQLGLLNRFGHAEDRAKIEKIFQDVHVQAYGSVPSTEDVKALHLDMATMYHQDPTSVPAPSTTAPTA